MRHVLRKWFWAWEFDEEESWLNEMSSKGLSLVSVGLWRYVFEDGNPGDYNIRLELLEKHPEQAESRRYIAFLEETGVEYIGNVFRWGYFRKKSSDGNFDLFSDLDSRIKHLKKIIALLLPAFILELIVGTYNVSLFWGLSIYHRRYYGNLFSGAFCLVLGVFIGFGLLRIRKKLLALKKERTLYE